MPFPSSLNRDDDIMEEVPVTTTPIFEGHLSVRTDKKQWQWRLFRFDGSNFTCLSTRKVKLQPNDNNNVVRSNLITTPKDKIKRLTVDENKIELKYYQLPEWTIDVVNISSISVLKRAQKQKDLERWLFVLTKMWKFTQAVKEQVQQFYVQQRQQQQHQQQHQQQIIQQEVEDDNIPLVRSTCYDAKYNRTPTLSSDKIKVIEEWRKSLAELMANDPSIKVTTPPPIESIPDDDTMSIFTDITSVSNRQKPSVKRVKSRSIRRAKTNSISPQQHIQQPEQHQEIPLEGRPVPTLRKRRSDDVRNWMNTSKKGIDMMNFFQDVGTSSIYDEETNSHVNNNNPILKYHTSIRGKKLIHHMVNQQEELSLLKRTRRASIPLLTNDIFNQQSPLQSLSMKKKQEEEEMSLADLQKSLRQVSLHHNRSPSDSSLHDLQKTNLYYYHNIVAPAIPPFHQPHLFFNYE
ncbi:hypothetical protein MFLAVUS_010522 [Mucor flavus]|uniref:PH domain-containing protein n=1 Tax=Mucor flavus TaxID=439312 RepID=A0ABP9ZCZ7_9FUNG